MGTAYSQDLRDRVIAARRVAEASSAVGRHAPGRGSFNCGALRLASTTRSVIWLFLSFRVPTLHVVELAKALVKRGDHVAFRGCLCCQEAIHDVELGLFVAV